MGDDWRHDWERDGVALFPAFFGDAEVRRYERLCAAVVAKWRSLDGGGSGRTTNMASLTDPRYFDSLHDLVVLLELIADERILDLLRAASGHEPLFHNTQFFFEQPTESWDGDWHRDTQFDADDDADEKARMSAHTGAHFRIAFADDPWLEIVPGSHRRWDTEAELSIRKSPDPERRSSSEMPEARPIELARGDAVLFHAWSIHRGKYRTWPPRRTLDIIYGWPVPCPFAIPDPTCFADRGVLTELTPPARRFYERFIEAYRARWASGA